jgi:seryl-tRNA(Sec) selenium transferase
MLAAIQHAVRRYLGTDHLIALESDMATVLEALQGLAAQQQELSAAQATSFSNLQAAVDRLEAAVASGDVSPEIASAVKDLSDGFDAMRSAAEAADDGVEPAPPAPSESGDETAN